jgi:hypothetical protein
VILLSITLLAFAIADLVRWSPDCVRPVHALAAGVSGTGACVLIAAVAGLGAGDSALVAIAAVVALGGWIAVDYVRGSRPFGLAWILIVLVAAFAGSPAASPISGPLDRWYSKLPFPFARSIPVEQFLLALCAALFLLATANRVVRLILDTAGTPVAEGEAVLRGGRLLGPMERLIVGALVVAGDATGAAIIITAKGLLRLPDVRGRGGRTVAANERTESRGDRKAADDQVTEYLLIGTFSSLLLAAALAAAVLGAG